MTRFELMFGAFGLLIGRHAQRDDFALGTRAVRDESTAAGAGAARGRALLPVRLRGDLDTPLATWLDDARDSLRWTLGRAACPAGTIERALDGVSASGRAPLSIVFGHGSGASAHAVLRSPGDAAPDLELFVCDDDAQGGIAFGVAYATEVFDDACIARLAAQWRCALEDIPAHPDRTIGCVALLTDEEAGAQAARFDETAGRRGQPLTLAQAFDAQVARTPSATALRDDWNEVGQVSLSYAELDAAAMRVARRLTAAGVGPGTPVGLYMERSASMLVAMLGIVKAGAAYVPLDPEYPASRIGFMIEDAGMPLLLTAPASKDRLPDGATVAVMVVDASGAPVASEQPAAAPLAAVPATAAASPSDPAYVIYTSGSTGTPKGVVVSQASVIALVVDTDYVHFDAHDVVAQASNASFDAATWEIWGAWLNGACLTVLPKDVVLQASRLAAAIREQSISRLFLTTALFNEHASGSPDAFGDLDLLIFGGEAVDPGAVGRLLAGRPPRRLVNAYGPTETTTFATTFDIPTAPGEWEAHSVRYRTLPIGRPIRGARCRVLDARMRLVPTGVAGELYIGGDGVAIGYAKRQALTAERFVADPYEPGERLYRTGDLVRQAADGNIEYLGRIDAQVKLRGFRIELGEIEACLGAVPGIRQAAALVREDRPGDRRLVAYVVPQSSPGSDATANARLASDARAALVAELPAHMVPCAIVVLPALPLTPNGKLDRRALPAPGGDPGPAAVARGEETGAPAVQVDAFVSAIAALFVEVLGVTSVGADGDFFALGGHSLQATRLVSRIEARHGVRLSIRAVYESPTVAGLAALLRAAVADEGPAGCDAAPTDDDRRAAASDGAGAVGGVQVSDVAVRAIEAPLTAAQAALWYVCRLSGDAAQYNISRALRLRGPLDGARLERALSALGLRHDALRVRIVQCDDGARQRLATDAEVGLARHDVSARTWRAVADAEARRPFDLEGGALARFALLRVSPREHVLVVTMHHIVSDGWSLGVLMRDLRALYDSDVASDALEALPIAYLDALNRDPARAARTDEADVAWWRERLRDLPDLLLPVQRAAPARPWQARPGAALPVAIGAAMSARLRAVAGARGTTPFAVLMAAWQAVLGDWSRQTDFGIGVPVAGRDSEVLEGLVGYFVDMVVLRADLGGDPDPATLVSRVHDATLAAMEHRRVSFDRLVAELRPARRAGANPLFQVAFTYDSTPQAVPGLSGVDCEVVDLHNGASKFDLTLQMSGGAQAIGGWLEYASDVFDAAAIEDLVAAFERTLSHFVAAIDGGDSGDAADRRDARGARRADASPGHGRAATLADAAVSRAASFGGAKRLPPEDAASPGPTTARHATGGGAHAGLVDQLLPIWRETLGEPALGIDDDFFAHGGHSLLAVRLIDRIEKRTGHALRLASLVEGPTVRQLAASIEAAGVGAAVGTVSRCTVAINAAGSALPLWIVSGFGGQIMPYQVLSRELGAAHPLYVLDLNSLDGRLPAGFGIPDVARLMVEDLREVQPCGPYQLAGYSLGGKIVLEMARRLIDAGEQVRLVSLLDCFAPGYPRLRPLPVRVALHLREAWRQARAGAGAGAYLLARIRRLSRFAGGGRPTLLGRGDASAPTAVELRMEAAAQAMLGAWEAHEPAPHPGRLMLVRSGVRVFGPGAIDDDLLQGWGAFARDGIDLHHVHCTHVELLDPRYLPALADALRQRLAPPPQALRSGGADPAGVEPGHAQSCAG
ncbi:MAG: amino acid adenylation domain-containing protein [Lautropia sp.]